MKIYKNLVNSVAETLKEIFTEGRYADKAIERLFKKNTQWGSRDRRFVAEAVYDIVRYYRLYSTLAQSEKNFWFITAVWLVVKGYELPDWPEFRDVHPPSILSQKEKLQKTSVIAESYPDWLWQLAENEIGKETWSVEAHALNQQAEVVIRANTLKTSNEKLYKALEEENIQLKRVDSTLHGFELAKRENIFRNKYFKEGWFEVQDAGSQMIAEFSAPQPGQLVIDACAGAGGKTLYISALMKNKGKVISMDVEEWKLEELKKRTRRAGVNNTETQLINETTIQRLLNKADLLLLDVPCSGSGVIRRNPDSKWKLSESSLKKTMELQKKILSEYSKMVKPHGKLVYSTCSIFPSENRKQVDHFLLHHPEFIFVKEKTILPSEGYDGFYMCELKRNL